MILHTVTISENNITFDMMRLNRFYLYIFLFNFVLFLIIILFTEKNNYHSNLLYKILTGHTKHLQYDHHSMVSIIVTSITQYE